MQRMRSDWTRRRLCVSMGDFGPVLDTELGQDQRGEKRCVMLRSVDMLGLGLVATSIDSRGSSALKWNFRRVTINPGTPNSSTAKFTQGGSG